MTPAPVPSAHSFWPLCPCLLPCTYPATRLPRTFPPVPVTWLPSTTCAPVHYSQSPDLLHLPEHLFLFSRIISPAYKLVLSLCLLLLMFQRAVSQNIDSGLSWDFSDIPAVLGQDLVSWKQWHRLLRRFILWSQPGQDQVNSQALLVCLC